MTFWEDYQARRWANDIAAYERIKSMLENSHSDFMTAWCKRRLQELQTKWPNHSME